MKKILSFILILTVIFSVFQFSTAAAVIDDNEIEPNAYPYTSYTYDKNRAVNYAMQFYSGYNSYFYYINGNDCTNFVSQCVAYGFGSSTSTSSASAYKMYNNGNATTGWFAGSGGGSSPWESVNAHWTYMRSAKTNTDGPRTTQITQDSVGLGDVMQIDFDNDGDYDHSVICVSTSPLKFAQHTSGTIKKMNEYEGTKRFYRPTSYRVY